MLTVTVLDTAIASRNLGDQIIMESVDHHLAPLLKDAFVHRVATHDVMGHRGRKLLSVSDLAIVGGTNLLSSHMWLRPIWKLTPLNARQMKRKLILMGVGWYKYQSEPDAYTKQLLRHVLSQAAVHSVRDSHTERMLRLVGPFDVEVTGCPTTWNLTEDVIQKVRPSKARNVVCCLNTYDTNARLDSALIDLLSATYEKVFFWVQTRTDYEYSLKVGRGRLTYISPSLSGLDVLLESAEDLDYVGNRLHAGIRALQKGRRAIIIEIDNRAREMGKVMGLTTVPRDDLEMLKRMIASDLVLNITIDDRAIGRWMNGVRALMA